MFNSVRRIYLITENCLRESIRQKIFYSILIISTGMILGIYFLRELSFGSSELEFIADIGYGSILFFGSILTILISAQLFFNEIDSRNAVTILAKPIHKSEFILGKFFGIITIMALFTGLMILTLILMLKLRESELAVYYPESFQTGKLVNYHNQFIYALTQWFKFVLLSSITILVSSYSKSMIFSSVSSFLILTICQLQYIAKETYSAIDFVPLSWAVATVSFLFPNFQIFNLGEQGITGSAISLILVGKLLLYTIVYSMAYISLAAFCFSKREI